MLNEKQLKKLRKKAYKNDKQAQLKLALYYADNGEEEWFRFWYLNARRTK